MQCKLSAISLLVSFSEEKLISTTFLLQSLSSFTKKLPFLFLTYEQISTLHSFFVMFWNPACFSQNIQQYLLYLRLLKGVSLVERASKIGLHVLQVPCQPESTSLTLLSLVPSHSLGTSASFFFSISLSGNKSNFTSSPRNTFKLLIIFNTHN